MYASLTLPPVSCLVRIAFLFESKSKANGSHFLWGIFFFISFSFLWLHCIGLDTHTGRFRQSAHALLRQHRCLRCLLQRRLTRFLRQRRFQVQYESCSVQLKSLLLIRSRSCTSFDIRAVTCDSPTCVHHSKATVCTPPSFPVRRRYSVPTVRCVVYPGVDSSCG